MSEPAIDNSTNSTDTAAIGISFSFPFLLSGQEEDACANSITGNYDLGWHIGAVFILLLISFIGMLIPFWTSKMKQTKLSKLLFCS